MAIKKYIPIWNEIKEKGHCYVVCTVPAMTTIIEGVKQTKKNDANKPEGKILRVRSDASGREGKNQVQITFTLVEDTSIRNL